MTMRIRFICALALAVALCAFTVLPTFAVPDEPPTEWDDPGLDPEVLVDTGALSHVQNGAFDNWTAGYPDGWTLKTFPMGGEIKFAKIDWADANARHADKHNYGLGVFALCNSAKAPGYAVAWSALNIPAAGTYWVVVHATAWGDYDLASHYNSVAWYAIADTSDPGLVPDSAWRELYPDPQVCKNEWEWCNYLARAESVYVEPGSHIFVKAEMKFAEYYNWTAWGFDDIAVWDMEEDDRGPDGWMDEGDVTWDANAVR
jgi:hypothetical protein